MVPAVGVCERRYRIGDALGEPARGGLDLVLGQVCAGLPHAVHRGGKVFVAGYVHGFSFDELGNLGREDFLSSEVKFLSRLHYILRKVQQAVLLQGESAFSLAVRWLETWELGKRGLPKFPSSFPSSACPSRRVSDLRERYCETSADARGNSGPIAKSRDTFSRLVAMR
jgi:hypothetical protein